MPERCYDRWTPLRLGWITKAKGMNAYVEWDDGTKEWRDYDSLGHAPDDA